MTKKFNLIHEPWITVLARDGSTKDISINDALKNAKDYVSLAGENRLQDIAILRMLSALTVTIMYRYDKNGNRRDLKDKKEGFRLYKNALKDGLPSSMTDAYLNEWENRFYLFDDEHPFMQVAKNRFIVTDKKPSKDKWNPLGRVVVAESKKGLAAINYFPAKTWVGTILESNHTKSPFANYEDRDNLKLTYSEAARWLVWFLSFSPCSVKNPGYFQSKMTWASGGALLTPYGENLHETILLNSVLFNGAKIYKEVSPIWERETTSGCEFAPYGENGHPDNLPELYTQQSRKLRLYEENGSVLGMFVVSGDYYGKENAFAEPMFMWKKSKGKDGEQNRFLPKLRNQTAPVWKELSCIIPFDKKDNSDNNKKKSGDFKAPGIVTWIGTLYEEEILDPEKINIPYQVTGVFYGSMNGALDKTVEDQIIINKKYFDPDISFKFEDTISLINKISEAVNNFSKNVALSTGINQKRAGNKAQIGKMRYEERISEPVLQCLGNAISIDELQTVAFRYANDLANELIESAPIYAYTGCEVKDKKDKNKSYHMNIACAETIFNKRLNTMYKQTKKRKEGPNA